MSVRPSVKRRVLHVLNRTSANHVLTGSILCRVSDSLTCIMLLVARGRQGGHFALGRRQPTGRIGFLLARRSAQSRHGVAAILNAVFLKPICGTRARKRSSGGQIDCDF